MTDRSKFEQMLEHLINEDQDKAQELFHQLVVEKSREIYETILSEDFYEAGDQEDEIGGDETDDFVDDIESDDSEDSGEDFGDESEEDFGDESEEGLEDRVEDLEDALDDLRAEFESLMSQEEGEDEHSDMDFGSDDLEGSDDHEFGGEHDFGMDDEEHQHESYMREYIEKVSSPKHGDDGVNNKSIVAKPNKIGGGTSANILNGGEDTKGMKKPSVKEEDFDNINVPGGNAGKTAFKTKAPAPKHGDDGVNKTSVVAKARKSGK